MKWLWHVLLDGTRLCPCGTSRHLQAKHRKPHDPRPAAEREAERWFLELMRRSRV